MFDVSTWRSGRRSPWRASSDGPGRTPPPSPRTLRLQIKTTTPIRRRSVFYGVGRTRGALYGIVRGHVAHTSR
eukprot:1190481-Prorocentrum_minimum.AAC.1